jgi:hypothetical protein
LACKPVLKKTFLRHFVTDIVIELYRLSTISYIDSYGCFSADNNKKLSQYKFSLLEEYLYTRQILACKPVLKNRFLRNFVADIDIELYRLSTISYIDSYGCFSADNNKKLSQYKFSLLEEYLYTRQILACKPVLKNRFLHNFVTDIYIKLYRLRT